MSDAPIVRARSLAARFFSEQGDPAQAKMILRGSADDFPEVQIAFLAIADSHADISRYRRALGTYAEPEFWEADVCDATSAFYDKGETARFALAGRELFGMHRD